MSGREPGDPFREGDVVTAADMNDLQRMVGNTTNHSHTLNVETTPTPRIVTFNRWASALALILAIAILSAVVAASILAVVGTVDLITAVNP